MKQISVITFALAVMGILFSPISASASLIGDEVTVEHETMGSQTGTVINDPTTPEFEFQVIAGPGGSLSFETFVNIESEEFWIEYTNDEPNSGITHVPRDWWIRDLNWIENGVVIQGNINDVTCSVSGDALGLPTLGTITISDSEVHIPVTSNVDVQFQQSAMIHCFLDVVHSSTVGGEFLPIETTSLLLAAAQSPAWLTSITIVALGIGAYVFTRNPCNLRNIKAILRYYLDRF